MKIKILFLIFLLTFAYSASADLFYNDSFENNSIQGWSGGAVESTAPIAGSYSYLSNVADGTIFFNKSIGMRTNNTFNVSFKFRHDITADGCNRFGVSNEWYMPDALPHIENNYIGFAIGNANACSTGGDATTLWAIQSSGGIVDSGQTCAEATTGAGCNMTIEINASDSGNTADSVWRFYLNNNVTASVWYTTKGVMPVRKANVFVARSTGTNKLWFDDITAYNASSTVSDTTAPTFSGASNTSPNFRRYQNFTANITLADNIALDYFIFSTNASGIWANISKIDISGTSYNASEQANISTTRGNLVCWMYYANDTSGNMVNSSLNYFTVANTAPTQSTPVLNSTNPLTNDTNQNLTAYNFSTDVDGDSIKSIFNWKVNGTPIATLNMPFEGINGTTTNNAFDYSGSGNNGTELGGVVWNATGGYDGKGAYSFDGIDDGVRISNSAIYSLNSFSVSFWVKLRDMQLNDRIIDWQNSGPENGFTFVQPAGFSTIQFVTRIGPTVMVTLTSASLQNNTWYHIVGTHDSSIAKLYVNGILTAQDTTPGINASSTSITLGRRSAATGNNLNGTIDDVMIFNRSLSTEQIKALFNNRTDLIVLNETSIGENWSVEITPNDGYDDGLMVTSNIVTILEGDVTAPNITINNPATNNTNYSTSNILFNATISDASIGAVNFSFNNASGIDFNISIGNWSGLFNTTVSANIFVEGRHLWQVFATDTAGNVNSSGVINFTIDRTPPNITLNVVNTNHLFNNSNFSIRSGNITLNVSAFDTFVEVQRIYFLFDNGTGVGFNLTAVNQSGNWISSYNFSTLAEGRQGVIVMANDSLNNVNNSQIINFTVDFTSPNVTQNYNFVDNSNFSIRTSNQTFNASVFDNLLLVDNVYFWFDNETSADFNLTPFNNSGQWIVNYNLSFLAEGKQGVRIVANDTVNNINNTYFMNFTVDFTPPIVNFTSPASSATIKDVQMFNITTNDNLLELSSVIFQFSNGSNPFNRTASNISGVWNITLNTTLMLAEGSLNVTIFSNDTVGNSNNTQYLSFTVDNIAGAVYGGSGSGGGGTSPFSNITQQNFTYLDSLVIDTEPGAILIKNISIRNNLLGGVAVKFICEGDVCSYLQYYPNQYFASQSQITYQLKFFVPEFPLLDKYTGAIIFAGKEKVNIEMNINLAPTNYLYNALGKTVPGVKPTTVILLVLGYLGGIGGGYLLLRKFNKGRTAMNVILSLIIPAILVLITFFYFL